MRHIISRTRKKIIKKGVKGPFQFPRYVLQNLRHFFNLRIKKIVPFSYEQVVSGWGIKGVGLPHFSARLYEEVKLLKEAIGDFHVERSLEIGCGYGRLTPWIAEYSNQHYAIEPESTLLKDAMQLFPFFYFHQSKAQELPFPDCHFDLCVTWTVLQHIPPRELPKAINEIKRVCTQKAMIIMAEGVGKKETKRYWEHPLEEWRSLLSPWKLSWYTERKREATFNGYVGLVMRFES